MPLGPILLLILLVLTGTGFFTGTLSRLRLGRSAALLLLLAALSGGTVTVSPAPGLLFNLGTALLPLGLALLLLLTADRLSESFWAILGAALTAAGVFQLGRIFPPNQPSELNFFYLDAQYLFALLGGVLGTLTGRTARGVVAASVLGVTAADLAHYLLARMDGRVPEPPIQVGGGLMGTLAVAAFVALALHAFAGQSTPALRPAPLRPTDHTG